MSYKYTVDWFSHNIPTWEKYLEEFKDKPIVAVELGVYEGRAACWLLDNILTHDDAELICVDTWKGSEEHQDIDMKAVWANFCHNIDIAAELREDRITIAEETTTDFLIDNQDVEADLIYIDASHRAADVLSDAVLADKILKPEGVLIFDDYIWGDGSIGTPKPAIDAFMLCYGDKYDVLHKGYQVILKKHGSIKNNPSGQSV